jgi:hypothetical protein
MEDALARDGRSQATPTACPEACSVVGQRGRRRVGLGGTAGGWRAQTFAALPLLGHSGEGKVRCLFLPSIAQSFQGKERVMQAYAQHPCGRLLVMALMAWVVVWGAPSARAQEDPSRAPEVSLVWQGTEYLCAPGDPESAESAPYLCAPVDPQSAEGELSLCLTVDPQSAEVVARRRAGGNTCRAGDCEAECTGGCMCISTGDGPENCECRCTE